MNPLLPLLALCILSGAASLHAAAADPPVTEEVAALRAEIEDYVRQQPLPEDYLSDAYLNGLADRFAAIDASAAREPLALDLASLRELRDAIDERYDLRRLVRSIERLGHSFGWSPPVIEAVGTAHLRLIPLDPQIGSVLTESAGRASSREPPLAPPPAPPAAPRAGAQGEARLGSLFDNERRPRVQLALEPGPSSRGESRVDAPWLSLAPEARSQTPQGSVVGFRFDPERLAVVSGQQASVRPPDPFADFQSLFTGDPFVPRPRGEAPRSSRPSRPGFDPGAASLELMSNYRPDGALSVVITARGGEGYQVNLRERTAARRHILTSAGEASMSNLDLRDMDHYINAFIAVNNVAPVGPDDGNIARTGSTLARMGAAAGVSAATVGYSTAKAIDQGTGYNLTGWVAGYDFNDPSSSPASLREVYWGLCGAWRAPFDHNFPATED